MVGLGRHRRRRGAGGLGAGGRRHGGRGRRHRRSLGVGRTEDRGQDPLADIATLQILGGGAQQADTDADRPAIKRVAGDLRRGARPVAGHPAIERADDRQVLQRIDDVDEVAEAKAFRVLPRMEGRALRGAPGGGSGNRCIGHAPITASLVPAAAARFCGVSARCVGAGGANLPGRVRAGDRSAPPWSPGSGRSARSARTGGPRGRPLRRRRRRGRQSCRDCWSTV